MIKTAVKTEKRTMTHGVLLDVHGSGVLITGKSGVGKSEAALDLITRGQRLVADDVVNIKLVAEKFLMGSGSELTKHKMEIRGLGIIDICAIFGIGSIRNRKRIELVIKLEHWDSSKEYERLGLEEKIHCILGIGIPMIIIPVRPGRNIATIIEVATKNHRLRRMGAFAAKELDEELINMSKNK
ncbi:hypothetical protein KKC91_12260 [bacterium]|nr:hypothetical protein [bacterium]